MIIRAVCRVLVGREEELSTLEDALLAACRGEGSVMVLAGDAGMGKSRLCSELDITCSLLGNALAAAISPRGRSYVMLYCRSR